MSEIDDNNEEEETACQSLGRLRSNHIRLLEMLQTTLKREEQMRSEWDGFKLKKQQEAKMKSDELQFDEQEFLRRLKEQEKRIKDKCDAEKKAEMEAFALKFDSKLEELTKKSQKDILAMEERLRESNQTKQDVIVGKCKKEFLELQVQLDAVKRNLKEEKQNSKDSIAKLELQLNHAKNELKKMDANPASANLTAELKRTKTQLDESKATIGINLETISKLQMVVNDKAEQILIEQNNVTSLKEQLDQSMKDSTALAVEIQRLQIELRDLRKLSHGNNKFSKFIAMKHENQRLLSKVEKLQKAPVKQNRRNSRGTLVPLDKAASSHQQSFLPYNPSNQLNRNSHQQQHHLPTRPESNNMNDYR